MASAHRPRRRRPHPGPDNLGQWAAFFGVSLVEAARTWNLIGDIERWCCFIGYPRSGHTLVASLLDAHPEMVISNELDAFRFLEHGFGKRQLYGLILWHERTFGYGKDDFDYSVPGAHQGSVVRLRVIGDKRGTATGFRLAGDVGLVDRIRKVTGVPIRVLQHSRNPFDIIATSATTEAHGGEPRLPEAIRWFSMWSRNLEVVRARLHPDEQLETRHERLVAAPVDELARITGFLGVDAPPDYLDRCAEAVWASPRRSRHSVPWNDDQVAEVDGLIARYPWLEGYTFDSE
jgi:hypothetical protein